MVSGRERSHCILPRPMPKFTSLKAWRLAHQVVYRLARSLERGLE